MLCWIQSHKKTFDKDIKICYTGSSIQAFKHSSIQAFKHSSIQAFKHSSIQAFKHSSIQAFKHSSIQAFKHSSILFKIITVDVPPFRKSPLGKQATQWASPLHTDKIPVFTGMTVGPQATQWGTEVPTHCHARESGHLLTHRDSRFHGNDSFRKSPLGKQATQWVSLIYRLISSLKLWKPNNE